MTRHIIANWKMNKTQAMAGEFMAQFLPELAETPEIVVTIAAPYTLIDTLSKASLGHVQIAAQDVSEHTDGAYTGEVSAAQLLDAGADAVIIGHSERRHLYHETSTLANQKIQAAIDSGLEVIYCVGETLEERAASATSAVITRQIQEGLAHFSPIEKKSLILAYEPVWAIGTGKVPTTKEIQEVHALIRSLVEEETAIVYGGSVTPENAATILDIPNVNGVLVGGASLDPHSFAEIVHSADNLSSQSI